MENFWDSKNFSQLEKFSVDKNFVNELSSFKNILALDSSSKGHFTDDAARRTLLRPCNLTDTISDTRKTHDKVGGEGISSVCNPSF